MKARDSEIALHRFFTPTEEFNMQGLLNVVTRHFQSSVAILHLGASGAFFRRTGKNGYGNLDRLRALLHRGRGRPVLESAIKVTLQVFSDPALIPPAIEGNSVDGGMLTYDQAIGQVAKGSTQRVLSPIDYSAGGDAIGRQQSRQRRKKEPRWSMNSPLSLAPLSKKEFL